MRSKLIRQGHVDKLKLEGLKENRAPVLPGGLAVLLHRGRTDEQVPDISIRVDKSDVTLKFPENWLEQHSLTSADLKKERQFLKDAGFSLGYL